jgi:preprotein translocase subunit SecG
MQKTSQSGGMGAALGGGAAESAFGSDTNNILTKGTVYGIIAFFLVALGLYLLYQSQSTSATPEVDMNSLITSQEEMLVAETKIEAVESSDLGETSSDLVESVEAGAAEAADAASSDPQPAGN